MENQSQGPCVLAIDDDPLVLRLVAGALTPNGFTVHTASRGAQGLEMARQEKPDLVLLDVTMPEMDGFEVCRRIQADPATREIPVIFLTGIGKNDEFLAKGFGAGACDYILKPFSRVELNLRVMAAIQARAPAE